MDNEEREATIKGIVVVLLYIGGILTGIVSVIANL